MSLKIFNKTKWILQTFIASTEIMTYLKLVVIVSIGLFYLNGVLPSQRKLNELQLVGVNKPLTRELSSHQSNALNFDQQLSIYYQFFPKYSELSEQISNIFDAAKDDSLTLESGTYEIIRADNHHLVKCVVSLPIKGSYIQARKLINDISKKMPNLAISEFNLSRQKVSDNAIAAEVKINLYYRDSYAAK